MIFYLSMRKIMPAKGQFKLIPLSKDQLINCLRTHSLREIYIEYSSKYNTLKYMDLYNYCKRENIPLSRNMNGKSKASIKFGENNKLFTPLLNGKEQEISSLYLDHKLSLADIATLHNTTASTVMAFLKKLGVKLRLRNGEDAYIENPFSYDDLYRLYHIEKLSTYQIADMFGYTCHARIVHFMKQHDIPRRNLKDAGKNCATMRPDVREKWIETIKATASGNPSKVELRFASWADSIGLAYISQHRLYADDHKYDYYIPSLNLLVEIDGVYWHKDMKYRDSIFDTIAEQYGYNIMRITDKKIYKHGDAVFYRIYEVLECKNDLDDTFQMKMQID